MSAQHGSERGRSAALDGVRGLAALSVLVYHVWLYTQAHPDATNRAGGWTTRCTSCGSGSWPSSCSPASCSTGRG